jgi:hypothetical protein
VVRTGLTRQRKKLFFIYNNPDDRLLPFTRSRRVIEEPGITKINLTTGPQAITGSTRMQATTVETFVIGCALELWPAPWGEPSPKSWLGFCVA